MTTVEAAPPFAYEEAFRRNLGIVSETEQSRLRSATVAIAGLGGVGGSHALTLARQGIGGFTLADPDQFCLSNHNRQVGAKMSTAGRSKAEVIREEIADIQPTARIRSFPEGIALENLDAFLDGADVVLDGLDIFALEARRMLYRRARAKGIWVLSAGPMGFGGALLCFDPRGMSFEDYFDLREGMDPQEQLAAFLAGVAPARVHLGYFDLTEALKQLRTRSGPSSIVGCDVATAMISTEAVSLLLGRRLPEAAPRYAQLDPYKRVYRRGRLRFGNRGPLQRFARRQLAAILREALH